MESVDAYFYITSAAFLTGFVLQGAWITSQKKNRKKYLLAVFATLITYFLSILFLRGRMYVTEPTSAIALPMMVLLCFIIALIKDTIPRISTQTVLLYTIFFWFAWSDMYFKVLSVFWKSEYTLILISSLTSGNTLTSYVLLTLAAIVIVPTISTICVIHMAYTNSPLNDKLKLLAYVWFLLIAVSLIASQFPGDMNNPKIKASASPLDVLFKFFEVMFSGMFIFQLAFYLSILGFVMPHDNEPKYAWKERTQFLIDKFSDQRLHPSWAYALAITLVATLAINSYLRIIPDHSMIALLALFSMQPVTRKENDDAVIMNDIVDRTTVDEQLEAAEQKQMERDREKLKQLVSKERKRVEGHN
jgi:hypothetical protein